MIFRLAEERDIESIYNIVTSAIAEMENMDIHQWDSIYPTKEDFLSDIQKKTLFVGMSDDVISVLFTISKECDEQYNNGLWEYPNSEYRVIHRLCVDPAYQNRGIAKKTLAYIENILRGKGIGSIRLDVFCNNPYAISLYYNSGYKKVGTAEWRKGKFLLMEKHL
jgi:ribosomal protein S18 acetylase RimI-like enzyme